MFSYRVFGRVLHSDISFPELRPFESRNADWVLHVSEANLGSEDGRLSRAQVAEQCEILLEFQPLRLSHSCTGLFTISDDGKDITWTPRPNVSLDAARADILGRVLAAAMHVQRVFTLHASAVAFEEGAIAFIAPKGFGKSTLGMALTAAGAQLVTDDMLAIIPGASPKVAPGVQSVRLRDDSTTSLSLNTESVRIGVDGKRVIDVDNANNILMCDTTLEAIYVLSPVHHLSDGYPVRRTQLSPVRAAIALVTHAKIGELLGGSAAPLLLDRAASLARAVPVYQLELVRDLGKLSDVVEEIFGWHKIGASRCNMIPIAERSGPELGERFSTRVRRAAAVV